MTTLIQKQRELFDKEFPKMPISQYVDCVTPDELKSFLTTCLIEHYEEDIRELEGMKDDGKHPETGLPYATIHAKGYVIGFNTSLSLAISLLQDKIKELKK